MKNIFRYISIIFFLIISFNSFSLFNGIISVHFIKSGTFLNKNKYAYFLERTNQGLLNSCYGEIQYHQQISWLPFLEINTETEHCSELDYDCIINGC